MDAKVVAMIRDLSREALLDLIAAPTAADAETDYLRSFVDQQYSTGQISDSDIIEAWDNDDAREWSGSPDPDDPDNFWIDDVTGERVPAR